MKRIPMDAESIAGINAHLKDHTRRVIVPQPELSDDGMWYWGKGDCNLPMNEAGLAARLLLFCPYSVGETVAITETFALHPTATEMNRPIVFYKARGDTLLPPNRWRSSRFMPADFARLHARITSRDVGRIQAMTFDEIVAEGYRQWWTALADGLTALDWWQRRWDGINAERGYPYSMNPWAYGYGFEVLEVKK